MTPAVSSVILRSRAVQPKQIAVRSLSAQGAYYGDSNGTDTAEMSRLQFRCASFPTRNVRLVYANKFIDSAGSNSIVVSAGLEYNGTILPVSFGGSRTVTISAGGVVTSDPVAFELPADASLWVRTRVSVASGVWPKMYYTLNWPGSGGAVRGADGSIADQTLSGTISAGVEYSYGPVAILGIPQSRTKEVSIFGLGDSNMEAVGDANYAIGFLMRKYSTAYGKTVNVPFINHGFSGVTAQTRAGNTAWKSLAGSAVTHIICMLGINDVNTGRSVAQIQADLQTIWNAAADQGLKVYQATITPRATSTDSFATVENQSFSAAERTTRIAVNDWIRTLPYPLTGYLEFADAVETARDSNIWKVGPPKFTSDGLHLNQTAHEALVTLLDSVTLTT